MKGRRKLMALNVVVAAAALSAGVALAVNLGTGPGSAAQPAAAVTVPDEPGSSGGIALKLAGSTSSATGTRLTVHYTLDYSKLPKGTLPAGRQPVAFDPRKDVHIAGFEPGPVTSADDPVDGMLFIQLPPVTPGAEPILTIERIELPNGFRTEVVTGPWTLRLTSPATPPPH